MKCCIVGIMIRGGGVLRFSLVGDVPPAAQGPYPCSGVVFPKNIRDFFGKRYSFRAILPQKDTNFQNQIHDEPYMELFLLDRI